MFTGKKARYLDYIAKRRQSGRKPWREKFAPLPQRTHPRWTTVARREARKREELGLLGNDPPAKWLRIELEYLRIVKLERPSNAHLVKHLPGIE